MIPDLLSPLILYIRPQNLNQTSYFSYLSTLKAQVSYSAVVTCGHHPHPCLWHRGHAACRHQSPRALACLSSLSTHRQHHHQQGPGVRNIWGSLSQTSGHVTHCHTQGAWDGGQARGVTLEPGTKTMAAWCRECEPSDPSSSELTLVAIRAIEPWTGRGSRDCNGMWKLPLIGGGQAS